MNRFLSNIQRTGVTLIAVACMATPLASHALVLQDDAQLLPVSAPASYLGVNIRDLDDHSAHMLGLKSRQGVEVIAVDHDAPAGKAGIHLRDVILTVDGKPVTGAQQFRETMRSFPPGKSVVLGVIREAKPMKFTIRLADRVRLQQQAIERLFSAPIPELGNSFSNAVAQQQQLANEDAAGAGDQEAVLTRPYRIGAELDAIGPQLSTFFGVKDGTGMLVKNVEPDSPAAAAGLQAGDVILKLNDEAVASPFDWMRAMQNVANQPIRLTIVRSKKVEVITVNPPKTQAEVEWPQIFNQYPAVSELNLEDAILRLRQQMDQLQCNSGELPPSSFIL
jgi:C-terminal processing protease CtpA/Prc